MLSIRSKVIGEIDKEREYQRKKYGDAADDRVNTPQSWVSYIAGYSSNWQSGELPPKFSEQTVHKFRTSMIKTAAICLAAVESLDRQRERDGRAFYEKTQ